MTPNKLIFYSMRPILWPIILLNATCVSISAGVPLASGLKYGVVLTLLASFGFVINDVHDQTVDRSNNARRLEWLSEHNCRIALMMAGALLVTALLLSATLSFAVAATATLIAIGLILYTYVFRVIPVASNVLAAGLIASPLWLPLLDGAANVSDMHLMVCVAAGVFAFSREIVLDLKDRKGDAVGGRRTIATLFGPTQASAVAVVLTLSTSVIGISFLIATTSLGRLYAFVAFMTVAAAATMLVAMYIAIRDGLTREAFHKYVLITRWVMALYPLGLLFYA